LTASELNYELQNRAGVVDSFLSYLANAVQSVDDDLLFVVKIQPGLQFPRSPKKTTPSQLLQQLISAIFHFQGLETVVVALCFLQCHRVPYLLKGQKFQQIPTLEVRSWLALSGPFASLESVLPGHPVVRVVGVVRYPIVVLFPFVAASFFRLRRGWFLCFFVESPRDLEEVRRVEELVQLA
jgi:hypothetical protein